jgi:hypothetical protein
MAHSRRQQLEIIFLEVNEGNEFLVLMCFGESHLQNGSRMYVLNHLDCSISLEEVSTKNQKKSKIAPRVQ